MNSRAKYLVMSCLIPFTVSVARADLIVYDITISTSRTIADLGTKFVMGCVVLALGIVAAAVISRKK